MATEPSASAEPTSEAMLVGRIMQVDSVTAEVARSFAAAGVQAILLKGPSIARWLYDKRWERTYGDSDFLVPESSFDAASDALRTRGFEPLGAALSNERPVHAQPWTRPDGSVIDLHHT